MKRITVTTAFTIDVADDVTPDDIFTNLDEGHLSFSVAHVGRVSDGTDVLEQNTVAVQLLDSPVTLPPDNHVGWARLEDAIAGAPGELEKAEFDSAHEPERFEQM